jgi:dihydrofolate synthase/folylpolyglutamate synthase
MNYAEAVSYLLSLGHETLAIKLGLTNITLLLKQLDNPHRRYRAVQIAGTNGKGSTAAMLHSICSAAALKSGLFTSPHLSSITERIRVGRQDISAETFARCATTVRAGVEDLIANSQIEAPPSFFEHVTAIALLAFAEAGVDIAILETGLGGRLDATTAAGATLVGISPIALDHQEHLGEEIRQIAGEKAAIIRSGVTAVVAPQSAEVLEVIKDRSVACGVQPKINGVETAIEGFTSDGRGIVTFQTSIGDYPHVCLALRGRHQVTNAAMAVRLAESLQEFGFVISSEEIGQGLATAEHPGRLEFMETVPRVLLDGAHNVAGAAALRQYLDEFVGVPITLVFGAMRDKQLHEMATLLFPAANKVVLTAPDSPRAASLETLESIAGRLVQAENITSAVPAAAALKAAFAATASHELICVAGSLYLVGELREDLLGGRIRLSRPA